MEKNSEEKENCGGVSSIKRKRMLPEHRTRVTMLQKYYNALILRKHMP